MAIFAYNALNQHILYLQDLIDTICIGLECYKQFIATSSFKDSAMLWTHQLEMVKFRKKSQGSPRIIFFI